VLPTVANATQDGIGQMRNTYGDYCFAQNRPISGVEELRIRGFREPTLFLKGMSDSVLGRYAGGAVPVPQFGREVER
jgi:hypothetical protein